MKKYRTAIATTTLELSTHDFRLLLSLLLPIVVLDETNPDVQYLISSNVLSLVEEIEE